MGPYTKKYLKILVLMLAVSAILFAGFHTLYNAHNAVNARQVEYDTLTCQGDGAAKPVCNNVLVLELMVPGKTYSPNLDVYDNHWDIDGDGQKEPVAWFQPYYGLLGIDRNNDGVINDQSELIGTPQRSAFSLLKEMDSNGDTILDQDDPAFATLRVWHDENGDSVCQQGELSSLADLRIRYFELKPTDLGGLNYGIYEPFVESEFYYNNGDMGYVGNVVLKYDPDRKTNVPF